MTHLNSCNLCRNRLTEDSASREHVIPRSIGGRKTVTGFICKSCNSGKGHTWDDELHRQLHPLSLLLGIRRQRGRVDPLVLPTSGGGKIRLHSDGKMTTVIPSYEEATDGNVTQIRVTAGSREELRKQIKGMQRKYPSLKKRSVDDLMSSAQERSFYGPDLLGIPLELIGDSAGRSLVKSAMALVFDAGIDPQVCDLALEYLIQDNAQPCFGYFYDKDIDLVVNRPAGKAFHCVYVKGDSGTGTILAYV